MQTIKPINPAPVTVRVRSLADYKTENPLTTLLLVGDPKCGKTRVAAGFPAPFILDCNHNLGSILKVEPELGNAIEYDYIDTDTNDNPIPQDKQWDHAMRILTAAGHNPTRQTIIIDDFGLLCQALSAKLLAQAKLEPKNANLTALRIQDYGTFLSVIINFFTELKKCKKKIVVTCHQKIDKDETTGMFSYDLAIPGQAARTLPGLFSNVFGLAPKREGLLLKYYLYTRPSGFHVSLGTEDPNLPPVIDITDKKPTFIYNQLGL